MGGGVFFCPKILKESYVKMKKLKLTSLCLAAFLIYGGVAFAEEKKEGNVSMEQKGTNLRIGDGSKNDNATYQVAIGYQAETAGGNALAAGSLAKAKGVNSIAVGAHSAAEKDSATAIGPNAKAKSNSSTAIGSNSEASGEAAMALGVQSNAKGQGAIAVGHLSTVDKKSGIGIGTRTQVKNENSVVVGSYVTTELDHSVYLGNHSKAASTAHSKRMEEYSKEIINGREHSFAGGKASGIVTVGREGREKRIQNVAAGWIDENSTDAVNGSQLYAVKTEVEKNRQEVDKNKQELDRQGKTIENIKSEARYAGALSSALAALNPMEYDPMKPNQLLASFGSYKNSQAVAVGVSHHFNENVRAQAGVSIGEGRRTESMVNVGFSWKIGKDDRDESYDKYKEGPISSIYVMQDEMKQVMAENRQLKLELEEMKKQLQMLMK